MFYLLAEAVWEAKQCPCIEQISEQGHWLINVAKHTGEAFPLKLNEIHILLYHNKNVKQPACFHEYYVRST